MASLPDSGFPSGGLYPAMRDMKWSPKEKVIAKEAFERALDREFEFVMNQTREKAAKIEKPSDLWELEHYLSERRKQIDREYDYRYSELALIFGNLIRKGRLKEEELAGLSADKLDLIRSCVRIISKR